MNTKDVMQWESNPQSNSDKSINYCLSQKWKQRQNKTLWGEIQTEQQHLLQSLSKCSKESFGNFILLTLLTIPFDTNPIFSYISRGLNQLYLSCVNVISLTSFHSFIKSVEHSDIYPINLLSM